MKALQKKKFHLDISFVTRDNVDYLFLYLFVGYGTSELKGNKRIGVKNNLH